MPRVTHLPKLDPQDMHKVFLHHDKASSHTARKTTTYLAGMREKVGISFIQKEDIPVKSPGAAPMDFFAFGYLKQRLFRRHPKTTAGLWKALREEWSTISSTKIEQVFETWKRRCRVIVKKWGKPTEQLKGLHQRILSRV